MRSATPVASLLTHVRYEVLPAPSTEESVVTSVPLDVVVTVTSSPKRGLDATLDLCERLRGHGYLVVPHVAARQVIDRRHLGEIATRLHALGVDDVFVPAGDSAEPAGAFQGAAALLRSLDELGQPFAQQGITGYPESHRSISDDVTIQSMWDKKNYATYMVSNLCFNASALRHWIKRIRARGVELPLYLGLAGPVEQTKLVRVAAKIGVAESSRFATGHGLGILRLSAPGAYDPTKLLSRLSGVLVDPTSLVRGVHLFTFNQIAEAEVWRQRLLS